MCECKAHLSRIEVSHRNQRGLLLVSTSFVERWGTNMNQSAFLACLKWRGVWVRKSEKVLPVPGQAHWDVSWITFGDSRHKRKSFKWQADSSLDVFTGWCGVTLTLHSASCGGLCLSRVAKVVVILCSTMQWGWHGLLGYCSKHIRILVQSGTVLSLPLWQSLLSTAYAISSHTIFKEKNQ